MAGCLDGIVVRRQICLWTGWRKRILRKRYRPEEIVAKIRQVDVPDSQGQSVVDAARSIGVSGVTY